MRYKPTGELVAVKFIERGDKVRAPPSIRKITVMYGTTMPTLPGIAPEIFTA